jgi:hypothetical protein
VVHQAEAMMMHRAGGERRSSCNSLAKGHVGLQCAIECLEQRLIAIDPRPPIGSNPEKPLKRYIIFFNKHTGKITRGYKTLSDLRD